MLNSTRALFFILFLILGFSNNAISQNEKPFYDLKVNIHPDEHYLEVEGVISFPSSMVQENKLVLLHATDTKGLDMTGANLKNFDSAVNNGLANYTLLFNEDTQDSIHLDLSYSLAIPTNHKINRITPEWIELNLDSFWQPIFASIPNIDYKVSVTLGGDYTLLSGDQYRKVGTGRYIIRNSISRRDIPFSAGQHLREVNGSLANSYSPLDSVDLQSIVDKSDHILAFLREYTNQIDDFDQPRRVIISPREEVGYSRKNYIVMSDVRSMSDTYLSDYLAHEFSHYWFSNANFQTKHHWLTETFA
jgi:hypothetical protein